MNANTSLVLAALIDNVEGDFHTSVPGQWGSVYLDNAKPHGMTRHQFAGHLGYLETLGLYRSQGDGYFGAVRLDTISPPNRAK